MKDFKVYQTSGMLNFLVSEASDVRKREQTLSGDIVSFSADEQSPLKIVVDIDSTGWTGCELKRTGINLYPYTTIPAYSYGWYTGSTALADATNPVFLKGGKKYAVSADQSVAATTSAIVRAWRADGTILENAPNVLNLKDPISGTTASYQASPKYYQLSTPNYAKPFTNTIEPTEDLWVDMRCSGDNRVGNDPMLQVGDSRTPYEPYAGTTISIPFPDEVGTITDGTLTIDYAGSVTLKTGGQTYTLTSVSPIETLIGDNNIWADAGPVSVTYPI